MDGTIAALKRFTIQDDNGTRKAPFPKGRCLHSTPGADSLAAIREHVRLDNAGR